MIDWILIFCLALRVGNLGSAFLGSAYSIIYYQAHTFYNMANAELRV